MDLTNFKYMQNKHTSFNSVWPISQEHADVQMHYHDYQMIWRFGNGGAQSRPTLLPSNLLLFVFILSHDKSKCNEDGDYFICLENAEPNLPTLQNIYQLYLEHWVNGNLSWV